VEREEEGGRVVSERGIEGKEEVKWRRRMGLKGREGGEQAQAKIQDPAEQAQVASSTTPAHPYLQISIPASTVSRPCYPPEPIVE
jgi:hypothetical protein